MKPLGTIPLNLILKDHRLLITSTLLQFLLSFLKRFPSNNSGEILLFLQNVLLLLSQYTKCLENVVFTRIELGRGNAGRVRGCRLEREER